MRRLGGILLSILLLGALPAITPAAAATPSAACAEANAGGLDISGTLGSTLHITRTAAVGETFFATLEGGVTNSLLIINGQTLFSGNTTGTRSYKVTGGTTLDITYDLKGTGAMRFSCESAPDPDPDPDPQPGVDTTTLHILLVNPPLLGLPGFTPGSGSPVITGVLTDLLNGEPLGGTACPTAGERERRMKELRDEIAGIDQSLWLHRGEKEHAQSRRRSAEDRMLAHALLFDQRGAADSAATASDAEADIIKESNAIDYLEKKRAALQRELAGLELCAPMASQYAPTPEPSASLPAFRGFGPPGPIGGTQTLINESGLRVWTSGSATLTGGGPSDVSGARGAISVGAAKRLDNDTAIGGEIGLGGGRSELRTDATTADFASLAALVAVSHKLAENAQISLGVTGGYAWNKVEIGGATGGFASGEIGAFATLSGRHEMRGVVIAPSATLSATHTASAAYTLSDGTAVGTMSVDALDLSLALRLSMPVTLAITDLSLEPYLDFGGGYGLHMGKAGASGSIGVGVTGRRTDGIQFGLGGTLADDASGMWSAGISGRISAPL